MKVIIPTTTLRAALPSLLRIVPRATTLPILQALRLEATDRQVTITAADVGGWARIRLDAQIPKAGTRFVPAVAFQQFVTGTKTATVTIEGGTGVVLHAGRSRRSLARAVGSPDDFPRLPEMEDAKPLVVLPLGQWQDLCRRTLPAVPLEENRFSASVAELAVHHRRLTLVGTDGHRLVHSGVRLRRGRAFTTHLARWWLEWVVALRLPDTTEATLLRQGDTLCLRVSGWELGAHVLQQNFPHYQGILTQTTPTLTATLDRAAVQAGLDRLLAIGVERLKGVTVHFAPNPALRCEHEAPDVGTTSEQLQPIAGDGGTGVGRLSGEYVRDFLNANPEPEFQFQAETEGDADAATFDTKPVILTPVNAPVQTRTLIQPMSMDPPRRAGGQYDTLSTARLEAQTLRQACEAVQTIGDRRASIPALHSLHLALTAGPGCTVTGTNLRCSLQVTVPAQAVTTPCAMLVPIKPLVAWLKKMTAPDLTLTVRLQRPEPPKSEEENPSASAQAHGTNPQTAATPVEAVGPPTPEQIAKSSLQVTLDAGTSRFQLTTLPVQEFPAVPAVDGVTTWPLSLERLQALLKPVLPVIKPNLPKRSGVREEFQVVEMRVAGTTLSLVTTDGHRLAQTQTHVPARQDLITFWPGDFATVLQALPFPPEEEVQVGLSEPEGHPHVCVMGSRFRLFARPPEVTYPEYHQYLTAFTQPVRVDLDPAEWLAALRRLSGGREATRAVIDLTLRPGTLQCRCHTDRSRNTEALAVAYDGAAMSLRLQWVKLRDFLLVHAKTPVQLQYQPGRPTVILQAVGEHPVRSRQVLSLVGDEATPSAPPSPPAAEPDSAPTSSDAEPPAASATS